MTLELNELTVTVAGKPVIQNLSLRLARGEVISLIGPPGCGKSTLLRAVVGLQRVAAGSVCVEGKDLTHATVLERLREGVFFVAQGGRVFRALTVADNLTIASAASSERGAAADESIAYELFPRLAERRGQPAGLLSGGERQMLALGMAMISRPRLLLLDEPSGGLSPITTDLMFSQLRRFIGENGTSVVLVEQNIRNAVAISQRVAIMQRGTIAWDQAVHSKDDVLTLVNRYASGPPDAAIAA